VDVPEARKESSKKPAIVIVQSTEVAPKADSTGAAPQSTGFQKGHRKSVHFQVDNKDWEEFY
jgi:hypothetical protein